MADDYLAALSHFAMTAPVSQDESTGEYVIVVATRADGAQLLARAPTEVGARAEAVRIASEMLVEDLRRQRP